MTERPTVTAAALLTGLRDAGHFAPGGIEAAAAFLAARRPGDDPPLYLKILAAIGTFIATLFFLGFLGAAGLVDFRSAVGMIAWGGGFLVLGIVLALSIRDALPGLRTDMVAQTALTGLALGKVLVVVGIVGQFPFGTQWVLTLALLAVTVVTYPFSGSSLDRFLSPYAVAVSILWELVEHRGGVEATSLALTLYTLAAIALVAALVLNPRAPAVLRPIGFAALAALGSVVCFIASGHDLGFLVGRRVLDPRAIEALLPRSLVGLVAWAAGSWRRLFEPRLIPAVVGIVVLGFAAAPGIVFALGLLVLGHGRHDRALRVVGALALPAFLVLWYWARDLDFLMKSGALVASGIALLLARGWMAWQRLDRETTP